MFGYFLGHFGGNLGNFLFHHLVTLIISQVCKKNLQRRNVFVEEDCEVCFFGLMLTRFDPAGDVRVPAEIARIDVQDSGPAEQVVQKVCKVVYSSVQF